MEREPVELYKCDDCATTFLKLGEYNRHRKRHDRPHTCALCTQAFGFKTDLDRHRQSHRSDTTGKDFYCKIPGCKFRGTRRKDYLWTHLKQKHHNLQGNPLNKTLREYYEEFTRRGATPQGELDLGLLEASKIGDTKRILDLISRGADIHAHDSSGRTFLNLAISSGEIGAVEILINNGAIFKQARWLAASPFEKATYKGNVEMVKLLLEKGADISLESVGESVGKSVRESAFLSAIDSGNVEVVSMFIENGANINLETKYERPALHQATYSKDVEMVTFLLEKGADINLQGGYNHETALHLAVKHDEVVTRILLKAGANIEAVDSEGYTPLSRLVESYRSWLVFESTAKLLLEAGAIVKTKDWDAIPLWFQLENAKYNPYLPSP